jgi:hypothetical protein
MFMNRQASQPAIPLVIAVLFLTAPHLVSADEQPADRQAALRLFNENIRPIFHDHCYACHSGSEQESELALDSRAGILQGGSRGTLFSADQPNESLLLQAVLYDDPDLAMPPDGKLPEDLIADIQEWIRLGAAVPEFGDAAHTQSSGIDWQAAREFWSFQPPVRSDPPPVQDTDWPQQQIDPFILAGLEAKNLAPATPADRRTFVRRLYYDLLGLPPAPEEVQAFIDDDSPDAHARLVDRLLASPHYGQRWGRYWLDLARYADETASWLDAAENAWMYRDWVVSALNDDLPYDQFVRLQLAADLIPNADPADHAALG